jgi:dolichyl-phosphate-mannose--protein O-mannosyl transferase
MQVNKRSLRIVAKIIALVYAIPSLYIFPVVLAFGNRPWPVSDYIFAGLGSLYIIGLFLGLRWPGFGGLICIIFPASQLLQMIIDYLKGTSTGNYFDVFIFFLLLGIPGILYLIAWNVSRKQKLTTDTIRREKN